MIRFALSRVLACSLVVFTAYGFTVNTQADEVVDEVSNSAAHSTTGVSIAQPVAPVDLSGSWSGYWQSSTNRHHGPLRGYFTLCSDGSYQVDFNGRFFRIFPFRYTVRLQVVKEENGTVYLAGSSYLGRMFGTFTYNATATATHFVCHYRSCRYVGCFVLDKCCPAPACCN